MISVRQLILDPVKDIDWRSEIHGLWLASSYDLMYSGGGAFDSHIFGYSGRPSKGQSYIGTELDTGATWKATSIFPCLPS